MVRRATRKSLKKNALALLEALEARQLFSAQSWVPVHPPFLSNIVSDHGAIRSAADATVWAQPPFPSTPWLTVSTPADAAWHPPLAPLTLAPTAPTTPPVVDPPPPVTTTQTPPSTTATSQSVQLTIGDATGNTEQPLGINIGSSTSYAQGNVINNLLTQGGSFELADGRVIVTAAPGSTLTTLVVTPAWLWQNLGYAAAIGQTLVGSTGTNKDQSWTITAMADQVDSDGNSTGNSVITIAGSFSAVPAVNDSFFVQITGNASSPLADDVQTNGNVTITRDNTTAYAGNSSALFSFDGGTANTGTLKYYFGADGEAGQDVLQPGHTYQLSFWAKTTAAATANLDLYQGNNNGYAAVTLIADGQWHQYTVNVTAAAPIVYQNGIATINVSATDGTVNLDVVKVIDLTDQIAPGNPLSAEAVQLITQEGFSNIRYWDPNLRYASLDDLIGPADARPMIVGPGVDYDPLLGLPEMLELCAATHTQMWLVLPTTWTPTEMHDLLEYLGGALDTPYGAKRAADGHPESWFTDISMIHLEAGNESWNGTFFPNSYSDFDAYFARAEEMFHDVKTDPLYAQVGSHLSLIVNGWQWNTWFDQQAVQQVPDADAVDASAYTSGPNTEMDLNDLLGGVLSQQLNDDAWEYPTATLGKPLMIYEEAPGELNGGLTADTESAYATSLGAALATIRNAMVLERDYGISTQNLFTLYQNGDNTPEGFVPGHYGIFADQMTAQTNPRPIALAAELLDQAKGQILSSTLTSGWVVDSTSTQTDATTTQAADALVTYDGNNLVLTLFNNTVSDDEATTFNFVLPATLGGRTVTADWAAASCSVLSGPSVSSNNETADAVTLQQGTFTQNGGAVSVTLGGHSMASLVIPLS